MEEVRGVARVECTTVVWKNHKVNELITKHFPGEWEKDIAFYALALVSQADPVVATALGAEVEE
jgi:hypothetical protein